MIPEYVNKWMNIKDSKRFVSGLFVLLVLTMPFGSNILDFSLGWFYLYPFLACLLILTFVGLLHLKLIKQVFEKYILAVFLLWMLYGIVQFLFLKNGRYEAIHELRCLGLFDLTLFVIIWVKNFLGIEQFRKTAAMPVLVVFTLIFCFAIFEMVSGFHFAGKFTEKVAAAPLGRITFFPVFLFDNPNNLTLYMFLLGLLIVILDNEIAQKPFKITFVLFTAFFISEFNDSRLGVITAIFLILVYLVYQVIRFGRHYKKGFYQILLVCGLLGVALLMHAKYYGPLLSQKDEVYNDVKKDVAKAHSTNSINLRKNLLLNGWDLTVKSHFLGVGPGQFRVYHKLKKVKYFTNTNVGPHNWVMEILSQYGIIILLSYMSIFLVGVWKLLTSGENKIYKVILILSVFSFFILSNLPSSLMVFNINWFFTGIIIILLCNTREKIPSKIKDLGSG